MLSTKEVLDQSRSAFRQWGDIWTENARINGERYKADGRSYRDFMYKGTGRTLLAIGLGPSFQRQIEIIKQYRDNVDVAIVDKALGACIDHGIKPDYVFLSDAVVSYEDWCEPWIEHTEGVTLISNITANPKWQQNWKGPVYFTTNKDNIETEKIYGQISGCWDIIPASSNVGNTIIVFATQLMNYDEYLLCGYEFTFYEDMPYYAFKETDKRYWMRHGVSLDSLGNYAYITQNLLFTCRWLGDFYTAELAPRNIRIFNCSGGTICTIPRRDLERKMRHAKKRLLSEQERNMIISAVSRDVVIPAGTDASQKLNEALNGTQPVSAVIVKTINPEVLSWLTQRCA